MLFSFKVCYDLNSTAGLEIFGWKKMWNDSVSEWGLGMVLNGGCNVSGWEVNGTHLLQIWYKRSVGVVYGVFLSWCIEVWVVGTERCMEKEHHLGRFMGKKCTRKPASWRPVETSGLQQLGNSRRKQWASYFSFHGRRRTKIKIQSSGVLGLEKINTE